ncbi:hypothetical protein BDA96_02G226200 [Sorghum bicolor]|uniref:Uncharacterized protein n=1 Tax=Sorghum bicolor TaxID=4558 RepID=A0A921RPK6_SORBI|nr:hypothetical protein BDA96_02G226200 [Sorghum bicolor]
MAFTWIRLPKPARSHALSQPDSDDASTGHRSDGLMEYFRSHCCMRHRWSTYHRATIIYQGFENPSGDRLNSGLHLESLKQFFYLVLSSLYTDAKTFWP